MSGRAFTTAIIFSLSVLASGPACAEALKVALVDAPAMPDFRDRLQSALLEGGIQLSTSTDGRDRPAPTWIVSSRVQPVGVTASVASASDYCIGGTKIAATADVRLRDARSGAVIWGGIVTRTVSIGSDIVAGSGAGSCSAMTPWTADYTRLSTALALSAARRITFRISPLRVVAMEGRSVKLNRGGALLPIGTLVQATSAAGAPVRLRVTGSMLGSASASFTGSPQIVPAGALAEVIEEDDLAANARRYEKVELP